MDDSSGEIMGGARGGAVEEEESAHVDHNQDETSLDEQECSSEFEIFP